MTEDLRGGSLCHGGAAVSYSHVFFLACIHTQKEVEVESPRPHQNRGGG